MDRYEQLKKYEQVYISYGNRANSFLLTEYGFAIPNNPFDYFRVKNVTIESLTQSKAHGSYDSNLGNLKPVIRADLKKAGLNRDVLRMLRANSPDEIHNLQLYYDWLTKL